MAFEDVLVPWLPERIVADRSGLLVVDKPNGIPVHGGIESLGEDLVSRLTATLVAAGESPYLGVHQRLDKEASGVLVLARQPELNQTLAREFEDHTVKRVYVAGVCGKLPRAEGVLEHRLEAHKGDVTRVVRQGGKLARARYSVVAQRDDRYLVELRPETGRTHQLRVQLATEGAPIVGDTLYGGSAFPRLLLHAKELGLSSLGEHFRAALPWEFEAWLNQEAEGLGPQQTLRQRLRCAAWKRAPLALTTDTYRLVNEVGDGIFGVVVDRYGDYAVLAVTEGEACERVEELAGLVMECGARGVYVKMRPRADLRRLPPEAVAPVLPLRGEQAPSPLVVQEQGMRIEVRLGDGPSTGLFVDQRQNRQLVRSMSQGARVLNLFAYTGSFSVAAALGGAVQVITVDIAGRALEQARQNFRLNDLPLEPHRFFKNDAVDWVAKARRKGERFNLVVLDPPSFATRGGSSAFTVADNFGALAQDAVALLAPGGSLLAVTNHRKTSVERLRWILRRAAESNQRAIAQLKDLGAGFDCPDGPSGPIPSKSVLLTVE